MFPLRDREPASIRPWITLALIAANTALFLYEVSLPRQALEDLVQTLGLVPARFADPRWRAIEPLGTLDFASFVTSTFLHGGVLHVISNLWFLWIFGDNVEERFGRLGFLAFYLLCGITAGVVHVIVEPRSAVPTIGASGAIAGVMGAYLRLFPRGRIVAVVPIVIFPLFFEVPAVVFLGFWFLLQLFGAGVGALASDASDGVAIGGIAFWAHVGGFVAGLVAVPLFDRKRARVIVDPRRARAPIDEDRYFT